MNVEEVFSSKLRIKILKILFNVGELNVSEIARRLKINYISASKHLKILEDEGILQRKMFGRIRLYRVNELSRKTKALENLIDAWEHQNEK
ncbi:MAG TPA: winged helix-turn-helix domain-containing protein [Candidatus Acidoferrales bacterium]|nr:winged helix-turn-helix domain-containing protein [Candidatus Acidoferrales bacterium]